MNRKHAGMYFWNTLGIGCNAGAAFILLIFVTRICGKFDAGVFALGFANAQLMLTIGRYGMRAYQATDINKQVKFPAYLMSRLITCAFMLLTGLVYVSLSGYSFTKALIVFSITVIKMVDALEDVFHGQLQQNGQIGLAGKLLTIRNIYTMAAFILFLMVTGNLLFTCIFTGGSSVLVCLFINIPAADRYDRVRLSSAGSELKLLFISCFPLFISSFLSLYIYNIPKYAIDSYLTEDIQTFYGILAMPAFVINLFSEFIFKPLLTEIAVKWEENKLDRFLMFIFRLFVGILVITIIVVGFGYLIGTQVLSLIYGVDLNGYRMELQYLLWGGGFGACVYLLFHVLTAMRRQLYLLSGYAVSALLIYYFCNILVVRFGLTGASIAFFLSNILLFIIFSLILIFVIMKKNETIKTARKETNL